ncbi:MAG TPA: rhomboid family intramembrane serine protease [Planctomycetota bacterium]|nr:rhomboid family intramembrane serine protease [Planctomycetota bacterium]
MNVQGYRENAETMLSRAPLGTLLVAALAVAASLAPPLGAILIDLRGLAGGSEPWRILTGQLVHGSLLHLLLNLLVFVPVAALRERRVKTAGFLLEWAILAASVAAAVRLFHGDWSTFCGLSGVVYGLLILVLLDPGRRKQPAGAAASRRWAHLAVLFLVLKSLAELAGGGWIIEQRGLENALGVVYLAGSHVGGAAAGLAIAAARFQARAASQASMKPLAA